MNNIQSSSSHHSQRNILTDTESVTLTGCEFVWLQSGQTTTHGCSKDFFLLQLASCISFPSTLWLLLAQNTFVPKWLHHQNQRSCYIKSTNVYQLWKPTVFFFWNLTNSVNFAPARPESLNWSVPALMPHLKSGSRAMAFDWTLSWSFALGGNLHIYI